MFDKGLVETELQAATGISQDPGESDNDYRRRLILWTDDALPHCWEDLSSFTQQFYNTCVKVMLDDADAPVPTFPVHCDDITGDDMSTETQTPQKSGENKPAAKSKTAGKTGESSKAGAKPGPAPTTVSKDAFGLRTGSKSSQAAGMFVNGAKMAAVKKETGINHYNLLRKLEAQGHTVSRDDAVITLTAKAGDGGSAN